MKWFKLGVSGLLLGLIGLFLWQNQAAFLTSISFTLNLYFQPPFSWSHPLYGLLIFFGAAGFIAGLLLMVKPYLNMRRALVQERSERQQIESKPTPCDPGRSTSSCCRQRARSAAVETSSPSSSALPRGRSSMSGQCE